eukprot:4659584-Prymnesium_polylepis.4
MSTFTSMFTFVALPKPSSRLYHCVTSRRAPRAIRHAPCTPGATRRAHRAPCAARRAPRAPRTTAQCPTRTIAQCTTRTTAPFATRHAPRAAHAPPT